MDFKKWNCYVITKKNNLHRETCETMLNAGFCPTAIELSMLEKRKVYDGELLAESCCHQFVIKIMEDRLWKFIYIHNFKQRTCLQALCLRAPEVDSIDFPSILRPHYKPSSPIVSDVVVTAVEVSQNTNIK